MFTAKGHLAVLLSLGFLQASVGLLTAQDKKPAGEAKTLQGVVRSVSATNLVIVGTDKKESAFALSQATAEFIKDLKAGEKLGISYRDVDGTRTISRIHFYARARVGGIRYCCVFEKMTCIDPETGEKHECWVCVQICRA